MAHTRESDEVIEALRQKLAGVRTCIHIGCGDAYELAKLDCVTKIAIDAHPGIKVMCEGMSYFNIGIAEVEGKAEFWHGNDWGLSSLNDRGGQKYLINVTTLDDFVWTHRIKDVDALIIDTEGTTWQVLQGAKETLKGVKFVYAEVQHEQIYPAPRCKLVGEVTDLLAEYGLHPTDGLPSYLAMPQANVLYEKV